MGSHVITIADHLLNRLHEMGVKDIFGVPGDYNLQFLDYIESSKKVKWIGTCNELNAAYAADGYGRVKGVGAVVTTGGVGELSAMNGIAGSYAENVAVIHIVGMPSTVIQRAKLFNHHTFADGDFTKFIRIQQLITCANEVIELATAAVQIDTILTQCYLLQKPVVLGIASDLFDAKITIDKITPLNLALPQSNEQIQRALVKETITKIKHARQPLIVIDAKARNHNLIKYAKLLINKTHIPYVTTLMAKGDINEDNPQFMGEYFGKLSEKHILDYVDGSDLIIWFGRVDTDLNSAGYSTVHDYSKMLLIDYNQLAFFAEMTHSLNGIEFTNALTASINDYINSYHVRRHHIEATISPSLTYNTFWDYAHKLIKPDSNVLMEAGTSIFGFFNKQLPENVQVINQLLWGSIGYTVGATLGILASKVRVHTYLFVGDGSFQLTAQEVSTMLRHQYNPIIFLINNHGYTIERYIHGYTRKYNEIATWDYCGFVRSFKGELMTWKIERFEQLESLKSELDQHDDKLRFVEVILGKSEAPEVLHQIYSNKG